MEQKEGSLMVDGIDIAGSLKRLEKEIMHLWIAVLIISTGFSIWAIAHLLVLH
jgi:hypothetical protein